MKSITLNNINISQSLEHCVLQQYNNNNLFVGISSNALVVINKFPIILKCDYTSLLKGDDKEMLVLGGSTECITQFIHKCFTIRDSGSSIVFNFEDNNTSIMFQ
jgi:hypothetical protein